MRLFQRAQTSCSSAGGILLKSFLTALAIILLGAPLRAQPSGAVAGAQGVQIPGLDPGEILLGELNCIACHVTEAEVKSRLASKHPPLLDEIATRATPQWFRAYLTNPSGEKPGTTMPDLLHGLSGKNKADTVDALVHFLATLGQPTAAAPVGADQFKMQQGRLLYHSVGCVACHAPQEPVTALQTRPASIEDGATAKPNTDAVVGLQSSSVPLGNLARKITVDQLARFLVDPLKVRPSGRMPSLNLGEGEAAAIAMYLLRDQAPGMANPSTLQKIKGLSYQYYEENFNDSPNLDSFKPKATGFIDRFSVKPAQRQNNFGFRFTGFVSVPADGQYTFYTASDDGSRLYIGDKLVVQNDGTHGTQEKKGTLQLKQGEHPVMVTYFNSGGGGELRVSYEGPGLKKLAIPADALSHLGQPMVPLGEEKFVVDQTKADRGRRLFSSLGCVACHQLGGGQPALTASLKAKPLANLKPGKSDGCLSNKIKKGLPRYQLSETQRAALRVTLARREKLSQPLSPREQIIHTMAALNCFACHSRDGFGGPASERADYFTVAGEADLGDEGRIPPHLTRVGDKLRPEWLREVLLNKGAVRPYMATRMPQFGEANAGHLVSAFEKVDASRTIEAPLENAARDAKFGRKLVGRDGLTCVTCHTFGKFKSLGIPAMDMTQMAKRLKKNWFRHYLLDPQSLRPGTRMPQFWPEGKAANQDILDGNTGQQINAIWAYLSKGKDADIPAGLIKSKMELVATNEALIYRNFIEGAGARAIGVAYPEGAHLAFDANDLRLALIWQGAFIDASRHRTDRGAGFEPPLGDNVLKLPTGPPFAVLENAESEWPKTAGKKAGYQMKGYRLDDYRRPTFLYTFQAIQIEDHPVAIASELDAFFNRTLTLRAEQLVEKLWFRAAVGSKIEAKADGGFLVDGKLKLKFASSGGAKPMIRQSGGQSELLVPVVFNGKEAKIVEEMIW